MNRSIIVSAADSGYWPYLSGLLNSIDKRRRGAGTAVGVLDLGLLPDQIDRLKEYGAIVVAPGWDYDVASFKTAPPATFRAMTARPHLPKHFPGYDCYVWIDADCWVQDWHAVRAMVPEARRWGFAIVPEIDRAYTTFLQNGAQFASWAFDCYARCAGEDVAQRLVHYPVLNCGVFAAPSQSPVWGAWAAELGRVLDRLQVGFFFAEQTALNICVRRDNISTAFLPARFNWMCNRALPILSGDGRQFLEPQPPYDPIGIIHLAAGTRNGLWPVIDMTGRVHQRALTFPPLRVASPA